MEVFFTCVHLDSFDATVIEAMATTRIIKFVKLPAMSVKSEKQYNSYSTTLSAFGGGTTILTLGLFAFSLFIMRRMNDALIKGIFPMNGSI